MKSFLHAAVLSALTLPATAQDWREVEDILQTRCVKCHSGDAAPLGLDLTSHASLMTGSWNGAVVLPDSPAESPVLRRLRGEAQPRMPLDGPPFLEPDQIALIEAWISAGAAGPLDQAEPRIASATPPDPRADGRVTYDEVEPIFGRHCIECHSDNSKLDAPPEGLRLTSYESILAGGDRIVLIPGNAQGSEIIRRVEGLASPRMPFDGPPWLADEEILLLRDWISGGALSADGDAAPIPVGGRVRLRGILTGATELDGAGFALTTGTRIDDRPGVGDAAEVRGRVAEDGSIVAERFRSR